MKTNSIAVFNALVITLAGMAQAQIYDTNNVVVQTFAGFGLPTYIDGQGQFSAFSSPSQIVSDTASNLYVWDSGNSRVRKITPNGAVTTLAGGGMYFEGYGTNVSLSWFPVGAMAIDHANKLWLTLVNGYGGNSYLLSINTNGYVALENGGLTNLTSYSGICFDSDNNLYYSGGNRIYRYNPTSGLVQPFAGNGVAGNFDGQGPIFTAFANPTTLTCDPLNNIYVWDSGNSTLRRIDPNQNVSTVAGNQNYYSMTDGVGTNATFSYNGISAMFCDRGGNLYFVNSSCVRKMDPQTNVTTLAGVFFGGSTFADGPGNLARFNYPLGGCFSQGQIFVADTGNHRIRALSVNSQGQTVAPSNLQLKSYPGVQITGTIGRTYQIQSSADMNTWVTVAKVLLSSNPYLWIDTNPVIGNKFYRAVTFP